MAGAGLASWLAGGWGSLVIAGGLRGDESSIACRPVTAFPAPHDLGVKEFTKQQHNRKARPQSTPLATHLLASKRQELAA